MTEGYVEVAYKGAIEEAINGEQGEVLAFAEEYVEEAYEHQCEQEGEGTTVIEEYYYNE